MERYNLPILIHPGARPPCPTIPARKFALPGVDETRQPVASSMAMFRLVYGGVMERFPNFKIVTHHCGGVIPILPGAWVERRLQRDAHGHRTSSSPQAARILPPHVLRHRQQRLSAGLRCGMDFAGIGKLVFATDLPFCNQKGLRLIRDSIAAVDALDLAPGDRRKVFQSNAVDLFRLPLSTFV
ncbi:MAG: amidohydrolase family protein [Bilophila wadsworthia]